MKISEPEFIDQFIDRIYLCGNKTDDGKYVLTLTEAEAAGEQLYKIVTDIQDKSDKKYAATISENRRLKEELTGVRIALNILNFKK